MDQGPDLRYLSRRQVRRFVTHLAAMSTPTAKHLLAIRETYQDWPAVQAYAMAYYGALQAAEPIDLRKAKDTRS